MAKRRRKSNIRLILHHPGVFARVYWLGLAVLTVGAVLDGWTTFQNIAQYGPDIETHAALWLFVKILGPYSVWLSIPARIGFVLLVAVLWRPWCHILMFLCGLIYLFGAAANYWMWF